MSTILILKLFPISIGKDVLYLVFNPFLMHLIPSLVHTIEKVFPFVERERKAMK